MGILRDLLGPVLQLAGAALGFTGIGMALFAAGAALTVDNAKRQQRKQQQAARDAYNASLQDRLQMVDVQADAPRTLVFGRVRTVEGVRRRWSSGTNDEKLTLIVSLAGHEIDAVETVYFDETPLTLDGSGYVTTEPWRRSTSTELGWMNVTLNGSGGGSFTLTSTPVAGTVSAVYAGVLPDGLTGDVALSVSHTGTSTSVTLSGGTAGAPAAISWQRTVTTSLARVRTYLGTATQSVGGDLSAEYGVDKLKTTDHFRGIALLVVDLTYDPDAFPAGVPNITAVVRGMKVYDPRLDSTAGGSGSQRLADATTWAWSQNPAAIAYAYARHANGWAVPAGEIRTADIVAASTRCAETVEFTRRAPDNTTSTVNLPRYRCGIVIRTDSDPRSSMDEIMETMAGRWGWAGGVLRMRAGMLAATSHTLTTNWIAQRDGGSDGSPVVVMSNGVPRDRRVNRVTGRCVDATQRYQVLPFPAIEDAVLIADHGTYPLEVELQGVTRIEHAQYLGKIAIRESQAALRMDAQCNLSAYPVELFDVVAVTLPRYGMTAKTFECVSWRWHPAEGVQLGLAEITDAIYSVDELRGLDPAPNSALPAPWDVEQITGLAVTDTTSITTDRNVVTRTGVTWTRPVSQSVRSGGRVEVQYTRTSSALPSGDWPAVLAPGDSTGTTIDGLIQYRAYTFRARAINSLGVRGPWCAPVYVNVGLPPESAQFRLELGTPAIVLPASSSGAVTSYAAAFTTVTVLRAGANDTASWTLSRANGSGVSSTLSGGVLTITNVTAGTDASYVDVSATRSGYATLTVRLNITKAKAGANGANGNDGSRGPTRLSVERASPTWSNTAANNAITDAGFAGPINYDEVTQYTADGTWAQTRFYFGGTWTILDYRIDGNLLVLGSITTEKLQVGAATASQETVASASGVSLSNSATQTTSDFLVATFASTGVSCHAAMTGYVEITPTNAAITHIVVNMLFKRGTSTIATSRGIIEVRPFTLLNCNYVTIPLALRFSPPSGSDNYYAAFYIEARNSAGTATAIGAGTALTYSVAGWMLENKV